MGGTDVDKKVEKDRRDYRSLGYSEEYLSGPGEGVVVGAGCGSATEIGSEPADDVVVEIGLRYFGEELVVGDAVKGFGEINCHCCGSCGRSRFIETFRNCCRQRQEGRGGGVGRFETMLCRMGGKGFH